MAKRKKAVSTTGQSVPDWGMINPDIKPITVAGIQKDYARLLRDALDYVHYEVAVKTLASEFVKYAGKHYDRKEATALKKLPDYEFSTIGKYTYIVNKGGVLTEELTNAIDSNYAELLEKASGFQESNEDEAPKKAAPVISIQQRMRDQVKDMCGDWEGFLDDVFAGTADIKDFDPYKQIQLNNSEVKPAHAKIIRDMFESGYAEAQEVAAWEDAEIKEAYSHLNVKMRKAMVTFYDKIFTACDTVINSGKATRKTRTKKAPSKEKLVAKLKYKENESTLGAASINPISIVGSSVLWTYNTKTRKLGVYVADDMLNELSVKGTTVVGFDPAKSTQKTVRKPEELLKGMSKLARTKFQKLYDGIKTTETKMNGRINEHTLLVKVF